MRTVRIGLWAMHAAHGQHNRPTTAIDLPALSSDCFFTATENAIFTLSEVMIMRRRLPSVFRRGNWFEFNWVKVRISLEMLRGSAHRRSLFTKSPQRGGVGLFFAHFDQLLSTIDHLSRFDQHLRHAPVMRRCDLDLHLHRLQHEERLPARHDVTITD